MNDRGASTVQSNPELHLAAVVREVVKQLRACKCDDHAKMLADAFIVSASLPALHEFACSAR